MLYGDNYEEHERNIFSYNNNDEYKGYIYIYTGQGDIQRIPPEGEKSDFHGSFTDKKCYNIAKNEADIIITNPPFGEKWRQYVTTMLETGKKLIFWGNGGAPLYNWFMELLDKKKIYIVNNNFSQTLLETFLTPTYNAKQVKCFIYTTEDLSFQKPKKKYFSTKEQMLKNGTAYYDDNNILICDKTIPADTNEVLGVSVNIIKHGILNDGYEIAQCKGYFPYKDNKKTILENFDKKYQRYAPIKDGKECFARILIQKNTQPFHEKIFKSFCLKKTN